MTNFLWENLFKRRKDTMLDFLSKSFFFKDLTPSDLKKLTRYLHVRHYRPGELLFRQNEIGIGMYFILKGRIDIYSESNASKDEADILFICLLYTSPSPRDQRGSRMPSSA